MTKSNVLFFSLTFIFLCLLSSECDDPDLFEIPYVHVDFTINVHTDAEFLHLRNAANGAEVFAHTVGVNTLGYSNNGVIIYNTGNEFVAYDRTCPHDFPENYAVKLQENGNMAKCPNCSSVYIMLSAGFPSDESVSERPLKEYRAVYNINTGDVRVSN